MNPAAPRLMPQQKIVLHEQFADHLQGKPIYPVGIEISPSGVCNATCDFCFYAGTDGPGQHRKVFLDTDRLLEVLAEARALGVKAITWTGGGDPSLHPDIDALVDFVYGTGMEQGMFTNALAQPRYNPNRLSWVRITMTDRPARPDYIRAIRRGVPTLGFAFNYAGPRDDQYLWKTLHLAEDVQADYVQLRPALAFHGRTVDIEPPIIYHPLLHITDYKFEQARHKHPYKTCEGYHFVPFLWEDGNLDVCAYMRQHAGYTLGNVYRNTLKEILDRAPASVPVHEQCQVCCKLHEINLAVYAAREIKDGNFP